ncbi:MAG: hypothetical protein JXB50_13715 [Spirochaetes bacterium]|nr:hypothetical protein [Spirochaetota bacterium]
MKYKLLIYDNLKNKFKGANEFILKNPFSVILISYFIFTIIRFIISLLIEEPTIMGDELAYKSMAYNFFWYKNFYKIDYGFYINFPNYLYQLVISVSFFFKNNFYIIIKLINSLIMNLSIFPIYLLSKKFNNQKHSVFISIFSLLLPSYNYINFVMPDAFYFTMFLFAFYFTIEYFYNFNLKYSFSSGISLILLFFIKPHAISFIISTFLILFIIVLLNFKKKENLKKIIITIPVFLSTIIISFIILKTLNYNKLNSLLGIYNIHTKNFFNLKNIPFKDLLILILNHFSSFLYIYFLPCLISLIALINFIIQKKHKEIIFLSLLFLSAIIIFLMVFKFTINTYFLDETHIKRIHSRFYFIIYPLLILSFISFHKTLNFNFLQKIIILLTFIFISFYYIYFTKHLNNFHWGYVADNIDLSWTFIFQLKFLIAVTVIYILALISYFFRNKIKLKLLIIFSIFFFLLLNFGQIYFLYNYHNKEKLSYQPLRCFIKSNILHKDSNVLMIDSGYEKRMNINFWMIYNYKGILEIPQNSLLNENIIPADVDYIILLDEYKINFNYKSIINFEKNKIIVL